MMCKVIPLIVILGGTGTGKSKLAIEIAKRLGSEIISADSMQVYKGLDILTNKVTVEERAEVRHHMLDFVSPLINFTVVNYRDKSLPIIDRLLKLGKPPVIVGGTNYYIESLIWRTLVDGNKTGEKREFFNGDDDRENLILKIYEKLYLRSSYKAIERKSYDSLIEKYHKLLSIPNNLYALSNYCNKVLISLKIKLISDGFSSDVVGDLNNLINTELLSKLEFESNLFIEKLKECELFNKDNFLYDSIICCLTLKKNFIFISNKIKMNFNDILEDGDVSIERLFDEVENHELDNIVLYIKDNIQQLGSLVAHFIPKEMYNFKTETELDIDLNNLPSPHLYRLLKRVDSERADSLHPNDRRKILRSLEVWYSTGRKHSDIIQEQQNEGSALGGPLRFKNTIIFWLTADPEVLNKRLDDRVYQMLDRGLVKELLDFYSNYKPKKDDFTKGIFQSIGFKEFCEFLLLSDEEKFGEIGKKKLNDGIETLKLVTRRYVKYQNKWIRNRFFKYPDRSVPPVYNLDTTDIEQWDDLVLNPAMDVVTSTMEGKTSKLQPLTQDNNITKDEIISMKSGAYYCEICKRTFIGLLQWNSHIGSQKHKKVLNKVKRESSNTELVVPHDNIGNCRKKLKSDDSEKAVNISSIL